MFESRNGPDYRRRTEASKERARRLFPDRPHDLYITRQRAFIAVPQGLLYPLLASFRGLITFPPTPALAYWNWEPFQFWTKHSTELVRTLLSHMEALHNNPQSIGKAKSVYLALSDRVRILATEANAIARA